MGWCNQSKWIWVNTQLKQDVYGEFYDTFSYDSGEVLIQISADSNYMIHINGEFVDSGQYPDFPHYKVYDQLDITRFCRAGENHIAITVWYYGIVESQTYYKGNAALRFEVLNGDTLCAYSDTNTLSRLSRTYKNGFKKQITSQIGLSFYYDATQSDNWQTGELEGFEKSNEVLQELSLYERPIQKVKIGEKIESKLVLTNGTHQIYDLGREEVGYLTLRIHAKQEQEVFVAFGEHIVDHAVRWNIDDRDFRAFLKVGEGVTEYTNYFRRWGLRYLEIWSEGEIEVEYLSVLPCFYPINKIEKQCTSDIQQRIYDTGMRTLELCMHDHYEDCPWREQALYAMDSRNQMLCGYYAFKEYRFARASLYLLSKALREDGLLYVCAPSDMRLTIPSFSFHYITEVCEYTKFSGDNTLAREVFPVLQTIIHTFSEQMKNGLVYNFEGQDYWQFYEWTEGLANDEGGPTGADAALNCLFSIALQNMQKIGEMIGVKAHYQTEAEALNNHIRDTFYRPDKQLYTNRSDEEDYSELVNALAVLCGATKEEEAEKICEVLASDRTLTKTSLSMMCFKYDALLMVNKEKYRTFILEDIEKTYGKMLDAGATSFWETELGEADFGGAGSLCHGWSAMPVYYYHIL